MISYLSGKIISKKDKFVILDVNGVGYKVFLSSKSLSKIPQIGANVNLFCHLHVREDLMDLYGFLDEKELEFFEILEDIRGVGPKAALEISAVGPLDKIKDRILKQDENVFAGIPGIGSKRASTIILELTGKIKDMTKSSSVPHSGTSSDEAESALIQLGFSKTEAKKALQNIPKDKLLQDRIKLALKNLNR